MKKIILFVLLTTNLLITNHYYLYAGWQIQTVDTATIIVGGENTSLVLDTNNNPHISYFDSTNRDLKYAKWRLATNDWQILTVDTEGYLGSYNSLKLDKNNNPQIAYLDSTYLDLKYAKWTDNFWLIQTVDSVSNVGGYPSLELDSFNNPHITYLNSTNEDLKYAKWTGTGWQIQTVDSTGDVGMFNSLALDTNNNPHIAYYDSTNSDLKYARWTGTIWQIQTVDSIGNAGTYASLSLDTNNNPHIAYRDSTNYDLKYAKWTGTTWQIQFVDFSDNVGVVGISIFLDFNNSPHIAYQMRPNDDLKYAKFMGTTWQIENVDSIGSVGFATSLTLDSNNNPHISYRDATNGTLKYGKKISPSPVENIIVRNTSVAGTIGQGNETLTVTAQAEPGVILDSVLVKDQTGNILTDGIDVSGISIDASGKITGTVSIADLTRYNPLVNELKVGIIVKDVSGNKSTVSETTPLKVAVTTTDKPTVKVYNNLIEPGEGTKMYLRYEMPGSGEIRISVHDYYTGRKVKDVFTGTKPQGVYTDLYWDGTDVNNQPVPTGAYIIYLDAGGVVEKRKVMIVR